VKEKAKVSDEAFQNETVYEIISRVTQDQLSRKEGEVKIDFALQKGMGVNDVDTRTGKSAIQLAMEAERPDLINLLKSKGGRINIPKDVSSYPAEYETPVEPLPILHIDVKTPTFLPRDKLSVPSVADSGDLSSVCSFSGVSDVDSVESSDIDSDDIFAAIASGDYELFQRLYQSITSNSLLEKRRVKGKLRTPINLAASNGRVQMVEMLLAHPCSVLSEKDAAKYLKLARKRQGYN